MVVHYVGRADALLVQKTSQESLWTPCRIPNIANIGSIPNQNAKAKELKAHTRAWYPHQGKQLKGGVKRKDKRVKAHTRARYAHEGKLSDEAHDAYMLVQLVLPI